MVPTFILQSFDGVGVQLCPCNLAAGPPQAFTVASEPATLTINRPKSSPHSRAVQVRVALRP